MPRCNLCPYESDIILNVTHHIEDVHKGRVFLCKDCGDLLGGYRQKMQHKRTICPNSKFVTIYIPKDTRLKKRIREVKCRVCKQTFQNAIENRHHFEEVHLERNFQCNFCKKVIASHRRLHLHADQHKHCDVAFVAEYGKSEDVLKMCCQHCGKTSLILACYNII